MKAADVDEFVTEQVFAKLASIPVPVPAENDPQAPDTRELERLQAEKRATLLNVQLPIGDKAVVVEALNTAIEAEQARINSLVVDDESTRIDGELRWRLSQMTEADFYEIGSLETQRSVIAAVTERIEVLPSPIRRHRAPAKDRVRITFREL
jgi:hypothetical protein